MTQSMDTLLSARRADLDGGSPPAPTEATASDVEVIPPADGVTGEILPAVPPSAAGSPVQPAPEIPTAFPLIPPKVLGGLPYASNYMKLARTIHDTELVPKAFKNRPDAIMAAMMYGYELGLGPMQALNGLHVIEGKVGQDAELMRALITEQGHLFALSSGEDENGEPWATVTCRRKDWPEDFPTAEFTWTFQDGRTAGLVEWFEKWQTQESGRKRKLTWNPHGLEARPDWIDGTGVDHKLASSWQNYGEDMCIARATARAARANFADVLKGMSYTPEELREFDGGNAAQPEEAPPSPPPAATAPATGRPASQETASTAPTESAPDSVSPTRSEPSPAPADSPPPPAKAAAPAKKAAKKAPAAKKAAPIHTENARDLPGAATAPKGSSASEDPAPIPTASQADLAGNVPPDPPPAPEPGENGVLRELASSLATLISAQPAAQQPLLRGFLGGHFPGRGAADLTAEELQLAINIAGGWPQSADRFPIPAPAGEEVYAGFSTYVEKIDGEYVSSCRLCSWNLPESPTNANLPEFRKLELAKDVCQQHETGLYEDGTPFCPGRPVQEQMVEEEPDGQSDES